MKVLKIRVAKKVKPDQKPRLYKEVQQTLAGEHLHEFSNSFFKDKEVEQKWTTQQKELKSGYFIYKSIVFTVVKI